ncbi:hypothetical protein [Rhizobium gallicum]|uniref:hypothetical protein n=1 Tax=Rhizobium gallicum TaxID=56730 RepID=UPI0012EC8605|nr:hypothetical protein [Rhizobium gallicum]
MNVFQAANPNRKSGGLPRFGSGRLATPAMILNGVFAASAKIVVVSTNRLFRFLGAESHSKFRCLCESLKAGNALKPRWQELATDISTHQVAR